MPGGCDYEIVKVVKTEGERVEHLKGRRVMISWGLNLKKAEQKFKQGQVLAFQIDRQTVDDVCEIILGVCCKL